MPLRASASVLGCLCGLLLGVLAGTGCTPNTSGSSAPSDTTTVSASISSSPTTSPTESAGSSPTPPAEHDQDRTVAERLNDASVAARAKQALVRTPSLRRFDFVPTVVRGHLTLRGDVETREQYRTAERVTSNVESVTDVTNQVTVQGRALSETGGPAEATYHTVRRGDTLWKISREYDVSVRQVRALNDLSGTLQPGQRIRVR